jgi:hypothetical protein
VTDPITNIKDGVISPNDGRVIGMALNQVVLPGFAAFHIGIKAPADELITPEEARDHLAGTSASTPVEQVQGENTSIPVPTLAESIMDDTEISSEGIDQQEVNTEPLNDDEYDE